MTVAIGPLVISKLTNGGGISHHELVHALQGSRPMHPYINEGQATFLGGVRGKPFARALCDGASGLRKFTVLQLAAILTGDVSATATDVDLALLNGVLAAMLVASPSSWRLSEASVSSAARNQLATTWHRELNGLLEECR